VNSAMSPTQLLESAREILSDLPDEAGLVGLRPRAAAVLARQALEEQALLVLAPEIPDIDRCSFRAKLICLQTYVDDRVLAAEVNHAWWALTGACHHRLYELAPTGAELGPWIDVVDRFVAKTAFRQRSSVNL
jgi:hypothetical protein